MNKTLVNVSFIFLFGVIIVLTVLLLQSYNTQRQQKVIIARQDQEIKQLEATITDLSAATAENVMRVTGKFAKEKGMNLLRELVLPNN